MLFSKTFCNSHKLYSIYGYRTQIHISENEKNIQTEWYKISKFHFELECLIKQH